MTDGDTTPRFPTSIGTSDASTIRLLGHDLSNDLIGKVGFGELAFWLVAQRRPSAGDVRVFESVRAACRSSTVQLLPVHAPSCSPSTPLWSRRSTTPAARPCGTWPGPAGCGRASDACP